MLDAETIIKAAGYLGIFGVIFAESGLLVGFFLPGDSLLFTAGFFASQGFFGLSFWPLLLGCMAAAIIGDSVGYMFGKKLGPKVFRRKESLFFSQSYIDQSQQFYERHGGKTVILARFVPVVRTIAPILAGVGSMPYSRFFSFNVIGGIVWTTVFLSLGYALGNIPGIEKYIELIVAGIVILSIAPGLWHVLSVREHRQKIWHKIKTAFKPKK